MKKPENTNLLLDPAIVIAEGAEGLARKRGALRRAELLAMNGGEISAEQAARRLGISLRALIDCVADGRLLGLRSGSEPGVMVPVFQFAADRESLLPGLKEVLAELRAEPSLDAWSICNFLLSPRDSLKGETPLDLLRHGQIRTVVALARSYAV